MNPLILALMTLLVSTSALAADASSKVQSTLDKAQKFLVSQQQPDGSWQPVPQMPPGVTAMVLYGLASDPNYGPNHPIVKKGFDQLLTFQQPDGGIYKDSQANYNTAIAVSAM